LYQLATCGETATLETNMRPTQLEAVGRSARVEVTAPGAEGEIVVASDDNELASQLEIVEPTSGRVASVTWFPLLQRVTVKATLPSGVIIEREYVRLAQWVVQVAILVVAALLLEHSLQWVTKALQVIKFGLGMVLGA
jgi:hypothetical protein